jgi:hypothetical protein
MTAKGWNRIALGFGALSVLAAIMTTATSPALGISPSVSAPVLSARNNGPVTLNSTDQKLVSLKVPAGHWLISGTMWADSQPAQSTTNTVVGCSIWNGSKFLDNSAFNTPKVSGSSAGVNVLSAAVRLSTRSTITFKCSDFGSDAVAHSVVLSAVG